MKKQDLAKFKLPDNPGVYFFRDKDKHILYIGKATSLRDRVRSYFDQRLIETRGLRLVTMLTLAETVTYVETASVLEALLLESKFIKEHKPIYNADEKDDKSFTCVVITKDAYPRVLIMRVREYEKQFSKKDVSQVYGPFTSKTQLEEAMKIVRKLFPYHDRCDPPKIGEKGRPCFNAQIGLCPGVCTGSISQAEYKRHIDNIKCLFEGKKTEIIKSLEKQMKENVKKEHFEKASLIRNTLHSLNHIRDIHLIKEEDILSFKKKDFRIEAYDVAHISGTSRVGVMVVIEGKEKEKGEYRKFKLPEKINNDYEGLREILNRRFNHTEWRYPDLVVIDGGIAHKQTAERVLAERSLLIPCVSVVKNERHQPKDILGSKVHVDYHKREILLANAEAHRFAIGYHTRLRNKRI